MKQNLVIFFILISTFALGQNHFVGFQAGLNLTSVTPKGDLENSSMRTGFIGGITYDFKFSNKYQIEFDALYSQQGFTDKMIMVEDGQVRVGEENYKVKYDYLSFPIKIGYGIGAKTKIIPKIGIIPAFLVSAKLSYPKFDNNGEITGRDSENHKDFVSNFDFGGLIEVGIEKELPNNLIFCSAINYKHSLTTYYNSDYFDRYDDQGRKHYGFSLSVGLKYRL